MIRGKKQQLIKQFYLLITSSKTGNAGSHCQSYSWYVLKIDEMKSYWTSYVPDKHCS